MPKSPVIGMVQSQRERHAELMRDAGAKAMLIERLQTVVDTMAQLAPEQQERLADALEDVLDEALWDAQFADPRSEAFFDELAAEARRGPLHPFPTPADMGDDDSSPHF